MRISFVLFIMFIGNQIFCQGFPKVIYKDSLTRSTPNSYEILDFVSGDLNRDEFNDLLIAYRKKEEVEISENTGEDVSRPLLIYLGNIDGFYYLTARCNKAVLCSSCGGMWGDPFVGLVIKNGYFTIEHYGGSAWRWSRYITFKYSETDSNWYLHKDGGDFYHALDSENVETEIKTVKDFGIIKFENFEF